MKYEELNRRVTQGIKSPDLDRGVISDCFHSAIRDLQEASLCSKLKVVKQCPSSTYNIVAGSKASGVVTLTLDARHYFDTDQEVVVADAGADYNGTVRVMSGGNLGDTYDANLKFQYTLGSNSPSAITSGTVSIPSLYSVKINPEYLGIDWAKDKAASDAAKVNKFKVECLSVDAVWIVNSDGTKSRVNIMSSEERQHVRDQNLLTSDDGEEDNLQDFWGSIDLDRGGIFFESPIDLIGKQIEFWMRYAIPYIADAHVATVKTADGNTDISLMDTFIETIPSRFHERLIYGIKYHIYKYLSEIDPKHDGYRQLFKAEWEGVAIPFVRQESNKRVSREQIDNIIPEGVFRSWRK